MRSRQHSIVAVRAIAASLLVVTAATVALNTIGHASAAQIQSTPEAEQCTVAPIDVHRIQELSATPVSNSTAVLDPLAPQVDTETKQAIETVIAEAVACANANDPLRSLALFTDRYISERFGPDHPDDLASLVAASSREPVPAATEDQLWLVSITDPRLASPGHVVVIVKTENRSNHYLDVLSLEFVDGAWKIDSWSPSPNDATPSA